MTSLAGFPGRASLARPPETNRKRATNTQPMSEENTTTSDDEQPDTKTEHEGVIETRPRMQCATHATGNFESNPEQDVFAANAYKVSDPESDLECVCPGVASGMPSTDMIKVDRRFDQELNKLVTGKRHKRNVPASKRPTVITEELARKAWLQMIDKLQQEDCREVVLERAHTVADRLGWL